MRQKADMDSFRRRIPFKFSEHESGEDAEVLDEQQQDAVVEKLRRANAVASAQYQLMLRTVLALSALLQLVFLFSPSKQSPLLIIFPSSVEHEPSIPFPSCFTLLSLFLHLNLAILCHPDLVRVHLQLNNNPRSLSYELLYSMSAVPPTLSLFLQKTWQTTVWWCSPALIIFIVQSVMEAIETGNQGVAELESLKYVAPGA